MKCPVCGERLLHTKACTWENEFMEAELLKCAHNAPKDTIFICVEGAVLDKSIATFIGAHKQHCWYTTKYSEDIVVLRLKYGEDMRIFTIEEACELAGEEYYSRTQSELQNV